jgi:hypothetical protein
MEEMPLKPWTIGLVVLTLVISLAIVVVMVM